MRRLYDSGDNHRMILSLLMVIIGLVLAIWPGHVMTTALKILGIALLIGGGITLFSWYRTRQLGSDPLRLAEGVLLTLAGLFVLINPNFLISIIPFAVGAFVLLNGIVNLLQALDQRRRFYNRWSVSLTMAILTIVLGLLVMFNPFSTMQVLVMAIGIVMIYNGASNLFIERGYRDMYR